MTISGLRRAVGPAAFAIALLGGTMAWAQQAADQSHEEHHPPGAQPPAEPAPAPQVPQRGAPAAPGMGMPGGSGMMMPGADMHRMMQMMQGMRGMMMGGMGPMPAPAAGAPSMRPFARIEGQLAFFRTELRITEAQMPQWNAFADVMRAQANRLRQAVAQAMSAGTQPASAPQLLERRLAFLAVQVETTRAASDAVNRLYATLTDEQKRLGDALMAEHLRDMRAQGM